jgi:hypothetical protein
MISALFGVVRGPSKLITGNFLWMGLILCEICWKKRNNFFGKFVKSEKNYSAHPMWSSLHDSGYKK